MIEGLESIGVHWPSLVLYMVNFGVLTVVLYLIAYKPLLRAVRRRAEEEVLADTLLEEAEGERRVAHEQARAELEHAHSDAQAMLANAMRKAREDAKHHSDAELARVRARTESIERAEHERIVEEGARLAVSAASEVLREALSHETQQALVRSALAEIEEAKPVVAEAAAQIVTVSSAIALSVDEWTRVGAAIRELSGEKAMLVHHVRPEVLGGLAIEIDDTIIDATVLGKLHQLRDELMEGD